MPAKSLQELVQHAKAHPRMLNFASPGYGTQPHLLGEVLKGKAGVDIVHVPYKSPAAALTDLLAGQVQIYFETAPLILPQAQAGKLRVLAIAGKSRLDHLPDVPTTREAGLPHLLGGFWSGLVAPAGTPSDIVETINSAANEAMRSQEVQSAMETLSEWQLGTPTEFGTFISARSTMDRDCPHFRNKYGLNRQERVKTMPYLQLDIPAAIHQRSSAPLPVSSALFTPRSWKPKPRRLSFRSASSAKAACGVAEIHAESASVLKCDIRRGRPPELRARLAECLIDACTRRLGLKAEYFIVEFTQHPGDDFSRPGAGLVSDWSPAEAS